MWTPIVRSDDADRSYPIVPVVCRRFDDLRLAADMPCRTNQAVV